MQSPFSVILRGVNRDGSRPLNILCADTHPEYLTALAKTEHLFFGLRRPSPAAWDSSKHPYPWNYQPLRAVQPPEQFRPDMVFDLVLIQDRAGEFQMLMQLAPPLGIPMICVEHAMPYPSINEHARAAYLKLRGRKNVFASEKMARAWGWDLHDPSLVIIDPAELAFVEKWRRLIEEVV